MAVVQAARPTVLVEVRPQAAVSLLQVVDQNIPDKTIEQIESHPKNKLRSRRFGLNRN
jgi:hypothetical protein